MSRRPAGFTQADVARILRAAEQVRPNGGYRVRLTGGELVLEPVAVGAEEAPTPEPPLDRKDDWRL